MRDFKQIEAWRRAHALSIAIHKAASGFTRAGFATLRSQLTRAADSMAATIVEGCASGTKKEFARYLDISVKSGNETEYHLLSARDHGLMSEQVWQELSDEAIAVRKMTYVYRRRILESDNDRGASIV